MKKSISGYAFNDEDTKNAIKEVASKYNYIIDPHGAVGYLALTSYQSKHPKTKGIILETAHPAKFKAEVEAVLAHPIVVPERLAVLANREKVAIKTGVDYSPFREWLLNNY